MANGGYVMPRNLVPLCWSSSLDMLVNSFRILSVSVDCVFRFVIFESANSEIGFCFWKMKHRDLEHR